MNNQRHLPSLLFIAISLSPIMLWAQGGKINPKVEVQRDYEGRIMETAKPRLSTVIPDSISRFNIHMDYNIFDKPYRDLYSFAPLPFVKLSAPSSQKQPWAFIRLGLTYPVTPEADLLIQAPLAGMSALLLTAQHQSFWGELPRGGGQAGDVIADQMQNKLAARYFLNWDKGRFEVGGAYNHNNYTYYGVSPYFPNTFDPGNLTRRSFMQDSMSHAYNLYQADFALSSLNSAQPGILWKFAVGWSLIEERAHLWGRLNVPSRRENLVKFKADVGVRFQPEQIFGFAIQGVFSNSILSSEFDRGVFSFHPYYRVNLERFNFDAGLMISGILNYVKDSKKANKFFLYPMLSASYQIIPEHLLVYADVSGEGRLNDYQSLMRENPWLSYDLDLHSSDVHWIVQAGFKGKIAERFGYNLYGQYIKTYDQYYYHNTPYTVDTPAEPPFPWPAWPVVYFDNLFALSYANEERLSAAAELSWNSKPLSLDLSGKYHYYRVSTGSPAWYKPKVELNFGARYQWRERIIATGNITYRGEVSAPTPDHPFFSPGPFLLSYIAPIELITKIKGFVDIGLKLEYRFASWFGVYAEAKNLLNADKQYYLLYNEPGTRIGGGVTFRF